MKELRRKNQEALGLIKSLNDFLTRKGLKNERVEKEGPLRSIGPQQPQQLNHRSLESHRENLPNGGEISRANIARGPNIGTYIN